MINSKNLAGGSAVNSTSATGASPVADIINLRQARKRKAREEKERQAAANRAKFGTSKAARGLQDAQKALDDKKFEQSQRSPSASKDTE